MRSPPSIETSGDSSASDRTSDHEAGLKRTLEAIQGVNAAFLELLRSGAQSNSPAFPFVEPLRSRISQLSEEGRLRLAQCGVLLVGAWFAQGHRWNSVARDTGDSAAHCSVLPHWLPAKEGMLLAHSALHVAWSGLKTNPSEAALLLGVSSDAAHSIESLSVQDLSRIAEQCSHWIQPRWIDRPDAWAKLVDLAQRSSSSDTAVTLRALRLSARFPETDRLIDEQSKT